MNCMCEYMKEFYGDEKWAIMTEDVCHECCVDDSCNKEHSDFCS